jgi:predicted ferric reductase
MELEKTQIIDIDTAVPVMTGRTALLLFLSVVMGVFMAVVLLPSWVPGLADSVTGESPKAFWYLSRGSAMVAFGMLWFSMALGVMISNKMARLWPGGPVAFDVHQYASLLGLAFALFHALILIGDRYIAYTMLQILVPFASVNFKPTWVALGQISIYLWALVNISFYIRNRIGGRSWRAVHFLSYAGFLLALIHGVTSGTDSVSTWAVAMYWFAGVSLLFLTFYRVLENPRLPFSRLLAPRTSGPQG